MMALEREREVKRERGEEGGGKYLLGTTDKEGRYYLVILSNWNLPKAIGSHHHSRMYKDQEM